MSSHLAWLTLAALVTPTAFASAADASRSPAPVEAPRPILLTYDDAPWAGPIILMPAAKPKVDPALEQAARTDPQAAIERGFALWADGWGVDGVTDELKPYLPADANVRLVTANIVNLAQSPAAFHPRGVTLLRVERLGRSIARYHYLHEFPRAAQLWTFTFARPVDKWQLRYVAATTQPSTRDDLFDPPNPEAAVDDRAVPDAVVGRFADQIGTDAVRALEAALRETAAADSELLPGHRAFLEVVGVWRQKSRIRHHGVDIVSTTALTPSLVRYVLVEAATDDLTAADALIVWKFFLHRGADGWYVTDVSCGAGQQGLSHLFPEIPGPPEAPTHASVGGRATTDPQPADGLLPFGRDPFRRN